MVRSPCFRKASADGGVEEGLDRVLEQLMHAAGEHNRPPPASDLVIEGLPRIKLDEATLGASTSSKKLGADSSSDGVEASQNKDCSVCLTEFELGQEVIRIPCKFVPSSPKAGRPR